MYKNYVFRIERELAIMLGSVSHHLHPDIIEYIKYINYVNTLKYTSAFCETSCSDFFLLIP